MGALEPWAWRTRATMRDKVVSAPTLVARRVNAPVVLTVPPVTGSPGP